MSKKLAANVQVDGVLYAAGSTPPKDVAEKITNPKAWGDGAAAVPDGGDAPVPYAKQNKGDLEAEVEKRNEGREDDAKIVVGGNGTKADLAEALEADDAAQSE